MLLASLLDVEARLGRRLTAKEKTRSSGLLAEAGALVRGYLGGRPDPRDEDAVDDVALVASRMVARVIVREAGQGPDQVESETIQFGPFGHTTSYGRQQADVILMASDKAILKPYRVGGGFTALAISAGRSRG